MIVAEPTILQNTARLPDYLRERHTDAPCRQPTFLELQTHFSSSAVLPNPRVATCDSNTTGTLIPSPFNPSPCPCFQPIFFSSRYPRLSSPIGWTVRRLIRDILRSRRTGSTEWPGDRRRRVGRGETVADARESRQRARCCVTASG